MPRVEPGVIALLGLRNQQLHLLHQQPTDSIQFNAKYDATEIEVRTHLGKRQITDRLVHQQIGHHWKGGSEMGSAQIKDWNSHESRFIPFGFDSFASPRFTLIVS